MSIPADTAELTSQHTEMQDESTAPMPATSLPGSGVVLMTKEQLKAERIYQTTMHMARELLDAGTITPDEYRKLEKHFVSKYSPTFGVLYSSLCLHSRG